MGWKIVESERTILNAPEEKEAVSVDLRTRQITVPRAEPEIVALIYDKFENLAENVKKLKKGSGNAISKWATTGFAVEDKHFIGLVDVLSNRSPRTSQDHHKIFTTGFALILQTWHTSYSSLWSFTSFP